MHPFDAWRLGGGGGGESVRGLGSALTLRRSARDVVGEERVAPRWDRWQMINDVAADRGGLGKRVASGAHWVHDGGQWRRRLANGAHDARGVRSDAEERL